jgi:PAS domain S-box-containing protein
MLKQSTVQSVIAKRFILYIVLFSAFITILTTAIQLYHDYNTDIDIIHTELDQIESVHLQSLNAALWASNRPLLRTSIDGLLKIRDMRYVEIKDGQQLWASAGENTLGDNIQRRYTMSYRHRNEDLKIGTLSAVVSLDGVYQRLIDKVWVILISNAVKTLLVAIFIYFLFFKLVGRHLSQIAQFSKNQAPQRASPPLVLEGKRGQRDELDVVVDAINDMQLRLQAQIREVSTQKNYLSQTLNSIGDAVVATDIDGNITRMNPAAERITAWRVSEALGKSLKIVFPIVDAATRKPIENPVDKVMQEGKTVYLSNHTTLIAKDGSEHQIADSAAPIMDGDDILGVVLVFNDVTEQYQLREAATRNKRDLQAIMDYSPAVIYAKSVKNGRYLFVNRQFENIFHLQRKDIIGKKDHDIFPKEFADKFQRNDEKVVKVGHAIELEEDAPQDDGTHHYLSVKFPLFGDDNKMYAVCGISADITVRKQQEEKLRRSQKMDALGKLTGGIAHDYNNLLGIIMGYAEQLSEEVSSDPHLEECTQSIRRAAERGTKLTRRLLAFTRHSTLDASVVDINELLAGQQLMLEKTLTVRIKLVLELAEGLWSSWLDSGDLEDSIINMAINAMHAIKGNGMLTLRTHNERLQEVEAKALHLAPGDYVLLSITDSGSGMSEEVRERVFDPFFSTKGERGTGLGLSQVYGFVERSGGSIKVYSELGHGTRFALYFPRCVKDKADVSAIDLEQPQKLRGTETLLVVDDEPALVSLACDILTAKGYRVLTATDGEEAVLQLERASLQKEKIDLVVSDVIMPKMDGYELAQHVQERYPSILMQMVSGFADDRNNKIADKTLHNNILYKPYTSQTLLRRVRRLLDQKKAAQTGMSSSTATVAAATTTATITTVSETNTDSDASAGSSISAEGNSQEAVSTKTLAAKNTAPALVRATPKAATNKVLQGSRILVMDDEDDVRELFRFNLKRLGCKVLLASEGERAVELYTQALQDGSTIDVVILDLSIPGGMGGEDVAAAIRTLHAEAKIIVASGYSGGQVMSAPQQYGFDAAIEKNFNRKKLQAVLESLVTPR